MEQENVVNSEMVYPILFIPKKCTILESNCEISDNVYIDLNITSPDAEGNETRIYSGFCNVKLVDSYNVNLNHVESPNKTSSGSSLDNNDIEQMPIVLSEAQQMSFPSYSQSQVWIDPSRSPYVYNHYDSSSKERYSIREGGGCITVEQHNTFITRNVFEYKESSIYNYKDPHQSPNNYFEHKKFRKIPEKATNHQDSNTNFYDEDELECGVFLSQLPEEIMNEKQSKAREESRLIEVQNENNALKQLMSTDIQSVSKLRKTILFLGHDSSSGHTIQNILYNDPMVKCVGLEVDNEVIIEEPSSQVPKKKKYQCDKCKQIFDQLSKFRQHMVGNHTNYKIHYQDKEVNFMCIECGKHLKNQKKFEIHCLGHGDPDLECPKCHKVFASKFTLRAHQKIHNRKFPCSNCPRSYSTSEELKTHLERIHCVFMCKYDDCSYETNTGSELDDHHKSHLINKEQSDTDCGESYMDEISETELEKDLITTEEADLKSEEFEDLEESEIEGEKTRKADSVIAKVMSNKIFLLNPKNARKHGRYHKSCEVCYKSFDRISDLKRHLIEHVIKYTLTKSPVCKSGTLSIICEICQTETFTKIDKYKAHLREHAKLTIYKCTFCDKSFSDSSNFSKHKKIHGISYFQCDLCHRKFNSKKMIALHMEYHNKNKPVKCRYCHRMFHFESMLKKHMKCAHNKDATATFRCRFCDDFFKTLKDKWDHEWVVHNVRKMIVDCLICGLKFRKYLELKRHCITVHELDIPPAKKLLKKKAYY